MAEAPQFFKSLVEHLPAFAALAKAVPPTHGAPAPTLTEGDTIPTTGSLRENRGGNVALRGIGIGIFARAYLDCLAYNISFDAMAKALATVDWHVLKIQKPKPDDLDYRAKIEANLEPLFKHMVSATDTRMKISSSAADADIAWGKIVRTTPALAAMMPSTDLIAA
jgi:hypothetical protein